MIAELGLKLDARGNVAADTIKYKSTVDEGVCLPATCAAASLWWCGRSARAVNAPNRWTNI